MTDTAIVSAITDTTEYTNLNPDSDLIVFINKFYNRLVDRDATLNEITGWQYQISSGTITKEYIGLTLANAILNSSSESTDRKKLINKLRSANSFSNTFTNDDYTNFIEEYSDNVRTFLTEMKENEYKVVEKIDL